ncbi:MAG: hypothetical protein ACLU9S_12870 [Oscillospiraceae bacterium]
MTGVEGYVESRASGYLAAVEPWRRRLQGRPSRTSRHETAIGALALLCQRRAL